MNFSLFQTLKFRGDRKQTRTVRIAMYRTQTHTLDSECAQKFFFS